MSTGRSKLDTIKPLRSLAQYSGGHGRERVVEREVGDLRGLIDLPELIGEDPLVAQRPGQEEHRRGHNGVLASRSSGAR